MVTYLALQKIANHYANREVTDRYFVLDTEYIRPHIAAISSRLLVLMQASVEQWQKLDVMEIELEVPELKLCAPVKVEIKPVVEQLEVKQVQPALNNVTAYLDVFSGRNRMLIDSVENRTRGPNFFQIWLGI